MAAVKSVAALGQLLARHVRMAAYADCFLLLSIVFVLALVPGYFIRASSQAHRQPSPIPADEPTSKPTVAEPVAAKSSPSG